MPTIILSFHYLYTFGINHEHNPVSYFPKDYKSATMVQVCGMLLQPSKMYVLFGWGWNKQGNVMEAHSHCYEMDR